MPGKKAPLGDQLRFAAEFIRVALKRTLSHARIHVKEVMLTVASDDAAKTALLYGAAQTALAGLAEVLDIYNGVLDGCSSLMLTGETAVGKYPVQAMEYLVRTAHTAL